MEPLAPIDLYRDLESRLQESEDKLKQLGAPTLKERRQNPTKALPLPSDLAKLLKDYKDPQSRGEYWDPDDFWDLFVECLPELEDLRKGPTTLWISPSRKSSAFSRVSHEQLLRTAVGDCSEDMVEKRTTLGSLAKQLGREEDYLSALTGSVMDNTHFRETLHVLQSNEDFSWSAEGRCVSDHSLSADLDVKFYPQRGDVRAYTVDHDSLRNLVGSIVHSLFHPERKADRFLRAYAPVWRVKNKNVVSQTDGPLPHCLTMACSGDVSSFTASFKNVWLGVYTLAFRFEETYDDIFELQCSFRDVVISCSVGEVLRLFLYLGFRMPVYDRDMDQTFVSMGGMLGVAGINTVACVLFACLQRTWSNAIAREHCLRSMRTYIGGDDYISFCYGLTVEQLELAWQDQSGLVRKYVGVLSEEECTHLPTRNSTFGSLFLNQRFCKKSIFAKWELRGNGLYVRYQSQYRIPLDGTLLLDDLESEENFERWISFCSDLWSKLPWISERSEVGATILAMARILFPSGPAPVSRLTSSPQWSGELDNGMSALAKERVDLFQPFRVNGYLFPQTVEDVKTFLIRSQRLKVRKVLVSSEEVDVILTSSDVRELPGTTQLLAPLTFDGTPTPGWAGRLAQKFDSLRRACKESPW